VASDYIPAKGIRTTQKLATLVARCARLNSMTNGRARYSKQQERSILTARRLLCGPSIDWFNVRFWVVS
jgi:hypothetical protein